VTRYWPAWTLTLLIGVISPALAAEKPVGVLDSLTGSAQTLRNGASAPAFRGADVKTGDRYVTGKSSILLIQLLDDVAIVQASDTDLHLKKIVPRADNPEQSRVELALQRGSVNINTPQRASTHVLLQTAIAGVSIAGGSAGVLYMPSANGDELTVRNDSARVSINYSGRSFIVPVGQSIQIRSDGSVVLLPATHPSLQQLPLLPQIDIDGAFKRGGIDLRIEINPTATPPSEPSPQPSVTPTVAPTPTSSVTATPTGSVSGTPAPTPSSSPAASPSPSFIPPATPTAPPPPTPTEEPSPTPVVTPSGSPTPTSTPTPTPTVTPIGSPTPTGTPTPSPSGTTPTPTLTPPPTSVTPTPVSPF